MATLLEEDTTELLPLATVKAYAKVTHNLEDALLARLTKAARKVIQFKTGCAIGPQTYRGTSIIRGDSVSRIESPVYPVTSFSVLVDGEALDVTKAVLEEDIGVAHLDSPITGATRLVIDWVAGYQTLTAVPADLVEAWCALVAFYYENRGADDQTALPPMVTDILSRHRVFRV